MHAARFTAAGEQSCNSGKGDFEEFIAVQVAVASVVMYSILEQYDQLSNKAGR